MGRVRRRFVVLAGDFAVEIRFSKSRSGSRHAPDYTDHGPLLHFVGRK
jgi:hypothetical protein